MAYSGIILATPALTNGIKVIGSLLTNPSSGQVSVDTGELEKGSYLIGCILTTSVAAIFDIQHRNSANTGNFDTPIRIRLSGEGTDYPIFPSKFTIDTNERIRIILGGAVTGEIQNSIFYIPVA